MHSLRSLTVVSSGGGVQSSVMALIASEGAFDRSPDCAILADTRSGKAPDCASSSRPSLPTASTRLSTSLG